MTITAIEAQRNRLDRVNLYVDGEFRTTLAREVVVRRGLAAGDPLSESQLRELEAEDLLWSAREAALSLLAYRARSSSELSRRLIGKGFPSDVVAACVQDLVDRKLLDDERFAESMIEGRVRTRPQGKRRLAQELRVRGVHTDVSAAVIDEVMRRDGISELDLAREAARKWSRRAGEDRLRARRRLSGFLMRRGFDSETIRQILRETELP